MHKFEERDSVILNNEGQKIFGVIHRPIVNSKYPVVLICHGLGGHKTGKYRLYVNLAQSLSAVGIGSLRIDFRGSGDSEGNFSEMTIEGEVSDAVLALDYLNNDPHIDQKRIGLFGRSFGGVVAVMAAQRFAKIKSMALWAPVFNGDQWKEQWNTLNTPQYTDSQREELMAVNGMTPGSNFFQELFALKLEEGCLALNEIPLFHAHGKKDEMVHLSHAQKYEEARKCAKGETKFILLPKSDHDFSNFEEQRFLLNETTDWFKKTLT